MIKEYTDAMLEDLLEKAAESPRLRTNLNIHDSTDDPINRLYIAAQPGSIFAIQRHPTKWELLTCVKGSCIVRTYDVFGKVLTKSVMGHGNLVSIQIPAGIWHNIEIPEPCVFMEVKPGPYAPVAPEDTLNISEKGMEK